MLLSGRTGTEISFIVIVVVVVMIIMIIMIITTIIVPLPLCDVLSATGSLFVLCAREKVVTAEPYTPASVGSRGRSDGDHSETSSTASRSPELLPDPAAE